MYIIYTYKIKFCLKIKKDCKIQNNTKYFQKIKNYITFTTMNHSKLIRFVFKLLNFIKQQLVGKKKLN